jgi:hypothetical protein
LPGAGGPHRRTGIRSGTEGWAKVAGRVTGGQAEVVVNSARAGQGSRQAWPRGGAGGRAIRTG